MKVLIIGSGAREHAVADAFATSKNTSIIYVSPGNDGIAETYMCIKLEDFDRIRSFCQEADIDIVFIGSEQPIAEGLSDYLRKHSIRVFAPSQAAAKLEYSKFYAKSLMNKYEIPTAKYQIIKNVNEAKKVLTNFTLPVVLKADGLAAGKGVMIAYSIDEAISCCDNLLHQNCGRGGVIAEEFLRGWEVSLFAITDGCNFVSTLFAQDHKQLLDGDRGPNTGGMGAICPVSEAECYQKDIEHSIVAPILQAMQAENTAYTGILYLGLMITKEGPKVIEFNCRLGDPETQAVLALLKTDFADVCMAVCEGKVNELSLKWDNNHSVAVVLAAPGYPAEYQTDIPISIPAMESKIYYAGVSKSESGFKSSKGRVLTIMATAKTLELARDKVYADIKKISFPNMVYRKDIGLRKNKL